MFCILNLQQKTLSKHSCFVVLINCFPWKWQPQATDAHSSSMHDCGLACACVCVCMLICVCVPVCVPINNIDPCCVGTKKVPKSSSMRAGDICTQWKCCAHLLSPPQIHVVKYFETLIFSFYYVVCVTCNAEFLFRIQLHALLWGSIQSPTKELRGNKSAAVRS